MHALNKRKDSLSKQLRDYEVHWPRDPHLDSICLPHYSRISGDGMQVNKHEQAVGQQEPKQGFLKLVSSWFS